MSEFATFEHAVEREVAENARFAGKVVGVTAKAMGNGNEEGGEFLQAVRSEVLSRANMRARKSRVTRVLLSFAR